MIGQDDRRHRRKRRLKEAAFGYLCAATTFATVILLAILLFELVRQGLPGLDMQFIKSLPSRKPEQAGIWAALMGTVWVIGLTALIAVPLGVAAAVYLEEFAVRNRLNTIIEINVNNLAGVPSIIYGMLGLVVFVRWFDLGKSVIAGALTLTFLILPVVIIAAREALRAVPPSLREASMALGATRWQTVWRVVLPSGTPGIATGVILALSRALGEAAPLIMLGALTYVPFAPKKISDSFTALPIQIFNWASRPQPEFHHIAASGILVLLAVLLSMNAIAVYVRYRAERNPRW